MFSGQTQSESHVTGPGIENHVSVSGCMIAKHVCKFKWCRIIEQADTRSTHSCAAASACFSVLLEKPSNSYRLGCVQSSLTLNLWLNLENSPVFSSLQVYTPKPRL